MGQRIHMLAMQRAAEIAGGLAPLARYLKVSPFLVAVWIQGGSDVPAAAFLKVVEIIVDQEGARMRGAIPASEAETFKHRQAANR